MAGLPPPPINDAPGSFTWLEWYRQLRNYVSTSGSVPWYIINFAGSNITDIALRDHANLQSVQGGASGEYYHLTQENYDAIVADNSVITQATNTTMTTSYGTYVATASGITLTLPVCDMNTIGRVWVVNQSVDGTVLVQRNGTDVIITPNSTIDTDVLLDTKGTSVAFKCISTSQWILV